jgi:hypothetical protein
LMKHECWDRVVASLKPVKGQIVDVQESRTLVRCFFQQNHVSYTAWLCWIQKMICLL